MTKQLSNTEKVARLISVLANQAANPDIGTRLTFCLHELVMEKYKAGVQAGYRKLLSDHRDGTINLSSTPRNVIDALLDDYAADIKPHEVFGGD
jgi:hypothetical protein